MSEDHMYASDGSKKINVQFKYGFDGDDGSPSITVSVSGYLGEGHSDAGCQDEDGNNGPQEGPNKDKGTNRSSPEEDTATFPHVSIVKNVKNFAVERCNPSVCTECGDRPRYHCPLCPSSYIQPIPYIPKYVRHLEGHLTAGLKYKEWTLCICKRDCHLDRHYHCPLCGMVYHKRQRMVKHLQNHDNGILEKITTGINDDENHENEQVQGMFHKVCPLSEELSVEDIKCFHPSIIPRSYQYHIQKCQKNDCMCDQFHCPIPLCAFSTAMDQHTEVAVMNKHLAIHYNAEDGMWYRGLKLTHCKVPVCDVIQSAVSKKSSVCDEKCRNPYHLHCPLCGESYPHAGIMKRHLETHETGTQSPRKNKGSANVSRAIPKHLVKPRHKEEKRILENVKYQHSSFLFSPWDLNPAKCESLDCYCGMYHCPVCPDSIFKPCADLVKFLKHGEEHMKYSITYKGFNITICRQKCDQLTTEAHYHCPECGVVYHRRSAAIRHLTKHGQPSHSNGSERVFKSDIENLPAMDTGQIPGDLEEDCENDEDTMNASHSDNTKYISENEFFDYSKVTFSLSKKLLDKIDKPEKEVIKQLAGSTGIQESTHADGRTVIEGTLDQIKLATRELKLMAGMSTCTFTNYIDELDDLDVPPPLNFPSQRSDAQDASNDNDNEDPEASASNAGNDNNEEIDDVDNRSQLIDDEKPSFAIANTYKSLRHQCKNCDFHTTNSTKFEKHLWKVHSIKNCTCEICGRTFTEKANLSAHIKHVHGTATQCICYKCGKVFGNRNYLLSHERRIHNPKPFSCEICGKLFSDRSDLKGHEMVHMDKVTRNNMKTFQCEHCEKRFTTKNLLKDHLNFHTGTKPYTCNICSHVFTTKASRNTHRAKLHRGGRKLQSKSPSKKGRKRTKQSMDLLDSNVAAAEVVEDSNDSSNTDVVYMCSECSTMFSDWDELSAHMEGHALERAVNTVLK